MRKVVPIALVVIALIIIGIVANGSKHSSTTRSAHLPAAAPPITTTETTTVTQPQATGQQASTSAVPKSGRCGDITVNQHTSCAFAQVVVKEYDAHPATTFLARSPVTGLSYTMRCEQSQGVVACADNSTSTLAFTGPPPANSPQPPATAQQTPTQTTGSVEGAGSFSHATDPEFCSRHECIENFPNGSGYIVRCADGEWSHSGGRSGACSDHGGES